MEGNEKSKSNKPEVLNKGFLNKGFLNKCFGDNGPTGSQIDKVAGVSRPVTGHELPKSYAATLHDVKQPGTGLLFQLWKIMLKTHRQSDAEMTPSHFHKKGWFMYLLIEDQQTTIYPWISFIGNILVVYVDFDTKSSIGVLQPRQKLLVLNFSSEDPPDPFSSEDSPDYFSSKDPPDHFSSEDSPNYFSSENPPPDYFSIEDSPDYFSSEGPPDPSSSEDSPDYFSSKDPPDHFSSEDSPDYFSSEDSPVKILQIHSPVKILQIQAPVKILQIQAPVKILR